MPFAVMFGGLDGCDSYYAKVDAMAAAGGDAAIRTELMSAKNAYKELVGRNPPNKPKEEKATGADGAAAAGGMSKRCANPTLLGPSLPYSCCCRPNPTREANALSFLSAPEDLPHAPIPQHARMPTHMHGHEHTAVRLPSPGCRSSGARRGR